MTLTKASFTHFTALALTQPFEKSLAEKQARMFDMFMSSKSGGRGLGLSVVNEIVSAHNGRIKVDSKPGLTRFSIFLPLPRTKKS